MSNTSKIVTGVVVILVIALGVWWYMSSSQGSSYPTSQTATGNPSGSGVTSTGSNPSTGGSAATTGSAGATDTSDASLNQAATNIDAQMNGLNSDNANTDTGLSSQ